MAVEEDRAGVDFALERTGTLSGRVTEKATGAALPYATITVRPAAGAVDFLRVAQSDSFGYYDFSGLPAVEVVVLAEHPHFGAEYYDGVEAWRGAAAATRVKIESRAITAGIDFRLAPRGRLAGRVVDAATGAGMRCSFEVIPADQPETTIERRFCGDDGRFVVEDLMPGPYYLQFAADNSYAFHLYGKGSCNVLPNGSRCRLADGVRVEIPAGGSAGPLEIRMEKAARLGGRVSFTPGEGGPYPSALLKILEEDGDEVFTFAADRPLDAFERLVAPGKYRLVADGSPNWQSFAWEGVACGRWYCDPFRGAAIELAAGETFGHADFQLAPIPAYAGCVADGETLCLNQGRYEVKARWKDFLGQQGAGRAVKLTGDAGYFYFFAADNLELMVKALDACDDRLGHRFWIYAAGLTNVEVELTAKDTVTGAVRTYASAGGSPFQPILDSAAFATCDAEPPAAAGAAPEPAAIVAPAVLEENESLCEPQSGTELCLGNGRFRARARFRGPTTQGYGVGLPITRDTGAFAFFSSDNLELVVKVLDACRSAIPGYWVFAAGLTDVAVDLEIEDLVTGKIASYARGPGPYQPVIDLGALPCN